MKRLIVQITTARKMNTLRVLVDNYLMTTLSNQVAYLRDCRFIKTRSHKPYVEGELLGIIDGKLTRDTDLTPIGIEGWNNG